VGVSPTKTPARAMDECVERTLCGLGDGAVNYVDGSV